MYIIYKLLKSLSMKEHSKMKIDCDDSFIQNFDRKLRTSNELDYKLQQWHSSKKSILQEPSEFFYRQDENGETQLHVAIILEHTEAALWMIEHAPHVYHLDLCTNDSLSALHLAVMAGQTRVARQLVLAGANLRLVNRAGNTALHLACIRGDLNCARALTQPFTDEEIRRVANRIAGAPRNDLEARNYDGETCLHIATSSGNLELVALLLQLGADVNAEDGLGGKTALHLAVETRSVDLLRLLTGNVNCNLEAINFGGFTAYQTAQEVDRRMAEELVSCGATPTFQKYGSDGNMENKDIDLPMN